MCNLPDSVISNFQQQAHPRAISHRRQAWLMTLNVSGLIDSLDSIMPGILFLKCE
jgi:hypothetical protein